MKWIGQHVWDFISRFRGDVYLENVAESTQSHIVGIDSDGKLYKQDPPAVPATTKYVHFQPTSYMFYCFYFNSTNYWYSPSGYATNAGNAAKNSITLSYPNQGAHAGYIAPSACKIKKIRISMYAASQYFTSSDDIAIEWAALKWTPGDDSNSSVGTTDMTITNHDGNYREAKIYSKLFEVTDNAASTLAAGDVFNLFGRVTNTTPAGSSTVRVLWKGDVTYEIELI